MNDSALHIVLTGVSRGLGRAMTHWFAAHGHRVSGCARNTEAIHALQQDPGPEQAFTSVDITRRDAVDAWAEKVMKHRGLPDLLINNAGLIHADAPFCDIPPDRFDTVIDVNVKGTANVMRAFLPSMIERGSGIVINISSGAGIRGYPEISGYCASKHAIEGLSKAAAQEIPEGMAIIPFQPGVIHTDMLELHYGDRANEHHDPDTWVQHAGPYLLSLGPEQNGESLRLPEDD